MVAACTAASSTDTDAGCTPAPPFSCNLQHGVSLVPFDATSRCLGNPVAVPDVCMSSLSENGACAAASLGIVCLVSPGGDLYFGTVRGDEDLTGPGWHVTEHRNYAPSLPASAIATPDERARCAAAECAPACAGASPPPLVSVGCPDGGVADAGGDGD